MAVRRISWTDLPDVARMAVEARVGLVEVRAYLEAGMNSALAVLLNTARSGTIFVKGLPVAHRGAPAQEREAMIAPYVEKLSTRLLWRLRVGGWDLLVFEQIEGRHADYTPGSPDLPLVIDVMRRLGDLRCPDKPACKRAEDRWAAYMDHHDAIDELIGDRLLHTDFNPCNVLIETPGKRARLIDWAWPTRGAAWIDPCCLIIPLIAAGHTPGGAEAWASRIPAWHTGSRPAIGAFARASARLWHEIAEDDTAASWKAGMARAAQRWADHRALFLE